MASLFFLEMWLNLERPVVTLFVWIKIERAFFWLPASCVTGIVEISIHAPVQI
jgi:hypothetical protein